MPRSLSVRRPSDDRAARRRLVWLLLRNGDLAGEELLSERASRGQPASGDDAPREDHGGAVTGQG